MKSIYLFAIVLFLFVYSCKPAQYSGNQIEALETLIEEKHYIIESDWAYPQVTNAMQQVLNSGLLQPGSTANAISLIGNPNSLSISNDSISVYLPYFGERQMNVGYGGGDSGIKIDGLIEDCNITKGKKNRYLIKFNARNKTENFNFFITLFPNMNSQISVNGASRLPISYSGKVKILE